MTPYVSLFALLFVISAQFTHVILAQPEDRITVYIDYSRLYLDYFDTSFEAIDLNATVLQGGYNFNIRIFPDEEMEIHQKTFNSYSTYYILGFGVFVNQPFPKLTSNAEFQLATRPPDYNEWEDAAQARHERGLRDYRREWNSAHEIMLDRPVSVDMLYIDLEGCAYYVSSVELQYVQINRGDWGEWDLQISPSEGSRFFFPWKRVELSREPQFDKDFGNNLRKCKE